jgi:hypothetical protein
MGSDKQKRRWESHVDRDSEGGIERGEERERERDRDRDENRGKVSPSIGTILGFNFTLIEVYCEI